MRQCGKTTVEELLRLLERVAAGEFQPASKRFSPSDAGDMLRSADGILARLPEPRDREIFLLRLGMEDKRPPTLAKVGAKYKMTRERVRQIVEKTIPFIRTEGGPPFIAQLRGVASICRAAHSPLTSELLAQWLGPRSKGLRFPVPFYVHLLHELNPEIPG
jgi:hypothetical protein